MTSPFHTGELQAQTRLGLKDVGSWARQVIRPAMPDQHREFFAQLPFLVAAARDALGRPWATLLTGEPGFVSSPDETHLAIASLPPPGDATHGAFTEGGDVGLLGIELDTRRRNRVNGRIKRLEDASFEFEVAQSFGNCPQYITERSWSNINEAERLSPDATRFTQLDDGLQRWISVADTFFVASGYDKDPTGSERNGLDASHRGGAPGFVEVSSPTSLVFPDYSGNRFFNTIGNLIADPRIGITFVDFEHGHLLQLTGRAKIDWDSDQIQRHPGAERLVEVEIDDIIEVKHALPIRWAAPLSSRRNLSLTQRVKESDQITSFYFQSVDGKPLAPFQPGQHLPIEVPIEGSKQPLARTYTLSNVQGSNQYRISVKREALGLVSKLLHDGLAVGDVLRAWPPSGDFTLNDSQSPVVLASAGVGITPMLSMLTHLADMSSDREILFIHGTRDSRHHAFQQDVDLLADKLPNLKVHYVYSRPSDMDRNESKFQTEGHITADLIRELMPSRDSEFYLCGPTTFLSDIRRGLLTLGVHDHLIQFESF